MPGVWVWVWGRGGGGEALQILEPLNPGRSPLLPFFPLDHLFFASPQAMDGSLSLEAALDERLKIINCKPKWVTGGCRV